MKTDFYLIVFVILLAVASYFACGVEPGNSHDCEVCDEKPALVCTTVDAALGINLPAIAAEAEVKGRPWLNGKYALMLEAECGLSDGNTVECLIDSADLCVKENTDSETLR